MVRLKEMRLEGEFDREEYRSRKGEIEGVIEGLEARLGGPEYDAEAAVARLSDVGEVVRSGEPVQRRRALRAVFERVEVSVESRRVVRVVPRRWFALFFRDVSELLWAPEYAWRGLDAGSFPDLREWIA